MLHDKKTNQRMAVYNTAVSGCRENTKSRKLSQTNTITSFLYTVQRD